MPRRGWPEGLCRALQRHQNSNLVVQGQISPQMQETEAQKRHLLPGLGLGGRGSQGSDEGHRLFLPTHALGCPGLAQTHERSGWGMEGLRHHPQFPTYPSARLATIHEVSS